MTRPRTQQRRRSARAHWTLIVVLSSYLSMRIVAPFFSRERRREALTRRHIRNAKRIEQAIQKLQGLYIKVGQLFSILANFLPEEFRKELEALQDQVPPRPYAIIQERIREELSQDPDKLFARFEHQPIASASLGQVHRARLRDGQEVAVKVQYPDIEEMVAADLKTLRRIVHVLSVFFPAHALSTVYDEIEQMVVKELDFSREGKNLERIRQNFQEEDGVFCPSVFWEYSTTRVITTEFIEGTKITHLVEKGASNGRGTRSREMAEKLVHAYCEQIFVHGVYHADPHPGNILVTEDNRIGLVDFGAIAELSPAMRDGIVDLLQGVITGNTDRIQLALRDMGFINRSASPDVIDQVIAVLHERVHHYVQVDKMNLRDVQIDPQIVFDTLTELRRLNVGMKELGDFFHIPSEWILLERTLLLLTGLCTQLDDELQPMTLIRPYMEKMIQERGTDWTAFALNTGKELGLSYLSLPGEIKKFLRRASLGRVEIREPSVTEAADRVVAMGRQLMWAAFAIASGVMAAIFHLHHEQDLSSTFAYCAGGFAALLVLSMLFQKKGR